MALRGGVAVTYPMLSTCSQYSGLQIPLTLSADCVHSTKFLIDKKGRGEEKEEKT